ncbi:dihydrodipicolinate synthase family protein [Paenarthrobacter aurescens]|uniref:dihydrodipicolinate synthase family protein n=1 Tax=Paenarthrobacter aurescens TaxID=43663 RepID=UPI0035F00B9B
MVATPFLPGLKGIDENSLGRLTRTLVERGCTTLVGLGVIAEPSSLSMTEKLLSMEAIAGAAGQVPVVATVMSLGSSEALLEAGQLARALPRELSAIMVPVTSSDPRIFRSNLIDVHHITGLPILIQDLPRATGIRISAEDLAVAVAGLDFIEAIKCEAEPTFARIQYLASVASCRLIGGFGGLGLVEDLRAGAVGIAAGITRPEVLAAALEAWHSGDEIGTAALIGAISGLINFETQPGTSVAIRKEHWRRQGIIEFAGVRPPASSWSTAFDPHSRFYGFI